MNKIKFLTPILGLGAVSSAVIPLTACGGDKDASFSLNSDETEGGWIPYNEQLLPDAIAKKDVIPTYTKHFKKNLNKTLAKDVAYAGYLLMEESEYDWSISITNCKFNKNSNRLSWKINVTTPAFPDPLFIETHNVKYDVEEITNVSGPYILFSPVGASGGQILDDPDWFIKFNTGSGLIKLDSSTDPDDWSDFWYLYDDFFEFTPYYLYEIELK